MKSYITIFANLCQSILRYVQYRLSIHRLQQRREGGFTLVELMVVVAVIAILAAIAMPQFMSAADKAKQAKELADIQIIRNATQLYMIDKSLDTPPTVETLYKEGYLTEHVKNAKGKDYVISYEQVDGNTGKSVVVTSPGATQ
ncbi:competence type IV pilus major pilin ComGC [Veillonella caviae]|uniref:competence type IV pilus major pilin ComGC n=1 Tax=Veillonella caviae TaxID=248316 RepID=UPI0023560468|nr:prepilin-type N-terminal cleavage/methylation domain-containing protein [Veillonella caviae]